MVHSSILALDSTGCSVQKLAFDEVGDALASGRERRSPRDHQRLARGTTRLASVLLVSLLTPLAVAQESRDLPLLDLAERASGDGRALAHKEQEKEPDRSPPIVDLIIGGASLGGIAGIAAGYCKQESLAVSGLKGSLGGGAIALLGIAYGAGESKERDAFVPSRDLDDLGDRNASSLGLVDVLIHRGRSQRWIRARILEISDQFVFLEADQEALSVPRADVLAIGKRDRAWDGLALGAGFGAGWGMLMSRSCFEEDPLPHAPLGQMAAWGAGIMGITGLALDLVRKNRELIYRSPHADPTTTRFTVVGPVFLRDGIGAAVTIRF